MDDQDPQEQEPLAPQLPDFIQNLLPLIVWTAGGALIGGMFGYLGAGALVGFVLGIINIIFDENDKSRSSTDNDGGGHNSGGCGGCGG